MFTLQKRRNKWYVRFSVEGFRVERTTGTGDKKLAKERGRLIYEEAFRQIALGQEKRMWSDLVREWIKIKSLEGKKTIEEDIKKLKRLDCYLAGDLELVKEDKISRALDALDVSVSTRDRYAALVKAMLRMAHDELRWIDRVPFVKIYESKRKRIVDLSIDQFKGLIDAMPQYLGDAAVFAAATGWRAGEQFNLKPSEIDFGSMIARCGETKNGIPKVSPIPPVAMEAVKRQMGGEYVFMCPTGRKIRTPSELLDWRKAIKACGMVGFRWHDLRHFFTALHMMAGTPAYVIQQLGGWNTASMVNHYGFLQAAHLGRYADLVNTLSLGDGKAATH